MVDATFIIKMVIQINFYEMVKIFRRMKTKLCITEGMNNLSNGYIIQIGLYQQKSNETTEIIMLLYNR